MSIKKSASKKETDEKQNKTSENIAGTVQRLSNDSTVVELALKSGAQLGEKVENTLSIRETVTRSLEQYFKDLDGEQASSLYQMVINEVEPAILATVLEYTRGNQSKAAEVLGLNRGTLRKKLKQYGLD